MRSIPKCNKEWIESLREKIKVIILSNGIDKGIEKYFQDKVYKQVIPRNVKLSEAPSYGMPIVEYDARSKGAKAYDKLAKEFLKKNEEEAKAKHLK